MDSLSYARAGAAVVSDGQGRLALPGRWYRKAPLDSYAARDLLLVYAPALHNARRVWQRGLGDGTGDVRLSGDRLLLRDLEGDPAAWARSIEELHAFLRDEALGARGRDRQRVDVSAALGRELASRLRAEVSALALRHASTPRTPPPLGVHFERLSRGEQHEILSRIRADLAREPYWGPWIVRRWSSRLDELERALSAPA